MAAFATFGDCRLPLARYIAVRVDRLKEFVYYMLHLFYMQNICFATYSLFFQQRLTEEKPLESIAQFVHFVLYSIFTSTKPCRPNTRLGYFFITQ